MEEDRGPDIQPHDSDDSPSFETIIVDVVYVDDDPLFCQIVRRELGKTTLKCRSFEDITDAMQFLETHRTRTLISDYRMPKMNGIEFLRNTRHLTRDVNVFITSACTLPLEVETEARTLGARIILKDRFIQAGYLENLCADAH